MRNNFIVFTLLFFFLATENSQSQDVSFSQYSLMPMYLNSAMTGFHNGIVRVGAIYRNQGMPISGFGSSYSTAGGFVDASLLKDKSKNDYLGIGASAFYDKNGINSFQTTDASFNLAYSKGFGKEVKHSIALGFGGEIQLKSLKLANAIYPDGVNENVGTNTFLFDATVGLKYHIVYRKRVNAYVGFAYHHLLQPTDRWTSSSTNKWLAKYVAHGGAEFYLNDKWNVAPTFLFAMQGSHLQAMVGAMGMRKFGGDEDPSFTLGFGFSTRFGKKGMDALIPQLRIDVKKVYAAASFDIQISSLQKATNGYGAFEIAIGYIFAKNNIHRDSSTPCPKF